MITQSWRQTVVAVSVAAVMCGEPTHRAVAAGSLGEAPVPPGEHPRVIFTTKELPAIRHRARSAEGQEILAALGGDAAWLRKQLGDPAWVDTAKQESRGLWGGSVAKRMRHAALLHQVTGEEEAGEAAAAVFRIWLSTYPDAERIEPASSWGAAEFALTYDWIHDRLSEADRDKARQVFASMLGRPTLEMFDREWWLDGPHVNGRSTGNWTPICAANLILTGLAVEGETGIPFPLLQRAVHSLRAFLFNGIAPDGALYEGTTYPLGYGTDHLPYAVVALDQRGLDLIHTTHLSRAGDWFAYEMLPWGGEAQAMNKSGGNYTMGTFPTFLSAAFGGTADWLGRWAGGWSPGPMQRDETIALVHGIPRPAAATPPVGLPPSRWFSTLGRVVCRTGWSYRDAHFTLNTNPLGAGHSNADHGHFTLASHGVNFVVDSGVMVYASEAHNLVHIDGKAQAEREGATESFMRSADFSQYADVMDADLQLAYERVLVGTFSGPWHWEEYNPVERADRRALFVRGATGPFVVLADDVRKDGKEREYEWRLHSSPGNQVVCDGRRFDLREGYGGAILRSLGKGQTASMIAKDVPAGKYRGWLLVRGEPYSSRWSNTGVLLNGKRLPYNTTYFALGHHGRGWYWNPVLPLGPNTDPLVDLPAGELRLDLESSTGGQVALALFTTKEGWEPGFEIPASGDGFVVLNAADATLGENPWVREIDPRSELMGLFLGPAAPATSADTYAATRQPFLRAVRRADSGRFLCLLAPHDVGDDRTIDVLDKDGCRVVAIRSKAGLDLVAGALGGEPVRGDMATDGECATVSFGHAGAEGAPRGYALVAGATLAHGNRSLVQAEGGSLHVVNDGETLILRGPGGARATCARLGATRAVVNGKAAALPEGDPVTVEIPKLPPTWSVSVSADGQSVDVTGNGPLPLRVHAPDAVDIRVNGVSRYFVQDLAGVAYPLLATGTELYQYAGSLNPAALRRAAGEPAGGLSLAPPPGSARETLRLEGDTSLSLPHAGPAFYRLSLAYWAGLEKAANLEIDGKRFVLEPAPEGSRAGFRRVGFDDLALRVSPATVRLSAPAPLHILEAVLTPRLDSIPPESWSLLGPFPTPWDVETTEENVKAGLEAPHPPETEMDLAKSCEGADGIQCGWVRGKPSEQVARDLDKGVNFSQLAFPRVAGRMSKVCYAVTFITSPDERDARLGIRTDWWAVAWLNGRPIRSERAAGDVMRDGAQFFTDSMMQASIRLNKGVNVLLVKNHGGAGGNRFVAFMTDPGDLRFGAAPD